MALHVGGPLMDLAYLEANLRKDSMVLLDVYATSLGIEVSPDTKYRYSLMTKQRSSLNKRKYTPKTKKRRRQLKKEALRSHVKRTKKARADKKVEYKAVPIDELVST